MLRRLRAALLCLGALGAALLAIQRREHGHQLSARGLEEG